MPSQWVNHDIRVGDKIRRLCWRLDDYVTVTKISDRYYYATDQDGIETVYCIDPSRISVLRASEFAFEIVGRVSKEKSGFGRWVTNHA